MKRVLISAAIFVFLACLASGPARADCIYNGVYYPTGTKLGDLTCQPDGTWR